METVSPEIRPVGLREEQIVLLRNRYGRNEFTAGQKKGWWRMIAEILREPMFILLLASCLLYFILGESGQAILMLAGMLFVAAISWYQEVRSTHALAALREFTEPGVTVIRDGSERLVPSGELVPGDVMIIEEGDLVPADATIIEANDLSVNESILTGESATVEKNRDGDARLFQGTTVNSGRCTATVTATGNYTELGRLGKSIAVIAVTKTILQKQIARVVKVMALVGGIVFISIWLLNYWHSREVLQSLLFALTLAMAIIPEEIPVAFSSFMALGAYRMARSGIITRQPVTIENLGRVSVICLDKTGTITENRMKVASLYDYQGDRLVDRYESASAAEVLYLARLASERSPFDAMEKAIVEAYEGSAAEHEPLPGMVHEYPLGGRPPMMTHVYAGIAAGKGAPERIVEVCRLGDDARRHVMDIVGKMASEGRRVLGVCMAGYDGEIYPDSQDQFDWQFKGLLALYDPPRAGVRQEFDIWRQAGIKIKLVTGDFKETALHIARETGLLEAGQAVTGQEATDAGLAVTGQEIMDAPEGLLRRRVETYQVFARMFPEAKLKLVEALAANGWIVAMIGDGVNDGPALKAAHIGIAMGKKGTEIAREAADLVLTDDKLERVTEAIRQGRKIYYNLKKAVRYIFSIHIPILLVAILPVVLNWKYPNIFSPVHIIFFELIMGPTCSVFFENEPVEPGMMARPPRPQAAALFSAREIGFNFIQGGIIAAGILLLYYHCMTKGYTLNYVRTMVFLSLMTANLFLTFTNRSYRQDLSKTMRYPNKLVPIVVGASVLFLASIMLVPVLRALFGLELLRGQHYSVCLGTAMVVTLWFEIYKSFPKISK
ncbi:MAG TPA: cation-translocating P-type ATPase [Puia sp.]|nr:cation-translocating P-type ATPase [Puia sp.]